MRIFALLSVVMMPFNGFSRFLKYWEERGEVNEPTPLGSKNANRLGKNRVNNIITIYQSTQVHLKVNMKQTFLFVLLALTFSALWAGPVPETVEDGEAKEVNTEVEEEDEEAARNARFNFGYSIQVCKVFFATRK